MRQKPRLSVVVFVAAAALLSVGCGGGHIMLVKGEDYLVYVEVGRIIAAGDDLVIAVHAQSFKRKVLDGADILSFICPCYLGEPTPEGEEKAALGRVMVDTLTIKLFPGAPYRVDIRQVNQD